MQVRSGLQVLVRGGRVQSRINALEPGESADQSDFGDSTCANGNTEFILFDSSGSQLQTFMVPPIGNLLLDNIPAGSYKLQDTRSSKTANFSIAAGLTTRVISLHYQPMDVIPDPPLIPTIDLDDDPPPPPPDPGAGDGNPDDGPFDLGDPASVRVRSLRLTQLILRQKPASIR